MHRKKTLFSNIPLFCNVVREGVKKGEMSTKLIGDEPFSPELYSPLLPSLIEIIAINIPSFDFFLMFFSSFIMEK